MYSPDLLDELGSSLVSWGFIPAAGSSRSNNFGSVANARAISRRR
jgi:hypothetical protein